jgi:hypothetical protein
MNIVSASRVGVGLRIEEKFGDTARSWAVEEGHGGFVFQTKKIKPESNHKP